MLFLALSLNLHIKPILILTVTVNVSSTCWVSKYAVKQLTSLRVDGIITKRIRIDGFLEDVKVTLIDKTQASDPIKREYNWMRFLKTLYGWTLMVWTLKVIINLLDLLVS